MYYYTKKTYYGPMEHWNRTRDILVTLPIFNNTTGYLRGSESIIITSSCYHTVASCLHFSG